MPDVTIKRIDEMEAIFDGAIARARASLGVTSFGIQVENLPPHWDGYPEHDEAGTEQEEVYVPLKGSAKLRLGGKEYDLSPGTLARVGPREKRKVIPGAEGIQLLVIGGVPGKPFKIQPWS